MLDQDIGGFIMDLETWIASHKWSLTSKRNGFKIEIWFLGGFGIKKNGWIMCLIEVPCIIGLTKT